MINSSIEIKEAKNSTIIGVQQGPTIEEIQEALRSGLSDFFTQKRVIPGFASGDYLTEALFACGPEGGSTLGFAVNNSGLIICPSTTNVSKVRQLTSGALYDSELVVKGNMLAAVSIKARTRGLLPSYRTQPNFQETLFTFNAIGERCLLSVGAICLDAVIEALEMTLIIHNGFAATFMLPQELIGGPVLNQADEVMGIAVGASDSGWLVVQPWSELSSCITLNVDTYKKRERQLSTPNPYEAPGRQGVNGP